MVIFILFPILAFFLGIAYQESVSNIKILQLEEKLIQLSRSPTPTPDSTSGWKVYVNQRNRFTFWYPKDAELTEETNGEIVLGLSGPTQRRYTEVYDGIWMKFSYDTLGTKLLKNIVDSDLEQQKENFDTYGKVFEYPKQISVSDMDGYTFKISNVETYTYIYLPNKKGGYLRIIYSTPDPTGKGFEVTVLQILSTFKFTQ